MISQNKILFWFRDNLSLWGNSSLLNFLEHSSEFTPVFCFDPREVLVADHQNKKCEYANKLINKVLTLRKNLQEVGSDLLVVSDHYEKIIPSLARVLNVDMVATERIAASKGVATDPMTHFREEKLLEINTLLRMHSIPLVFPQNELHKFQRNSFPTFPPINSGSVPSADQLLAMSTSRLHSIAR